MNLFRAIALFVGSLGTLMIVFANTFLTLNPIVVGLLTFVAAYLMHIVWTIFNDEAKIQEEKEWLEENIYEGYFKGQIQLLTIYDKYKDNI